MKRAVGEMPVAAPSPRRDFWMSMAAILLLTTAGYGFLWEPGRTPFSPYSDFIAEHVSTKQVLYDSIHRGQGLPLWREDQFSGYAGLINPQSQFTYPLHALFYLLPPLAAAGGTFFLHFLVSALGYYALGAALGLGLWPRLVMATAGLFSFKLILAVYAGWLSNIPIVVCLPLLYAAVLHLARRPSLRSALLLAGAGGLCLHTGHLQLFYYSLWFLAAYLLTRAIGRVRAGDWRGAGSTGLFLALGALLGAGLSAYLLLPLVAEAPLVSRSRTTYEFFLSGHAITPRHLLTFLFPEALGTPLRGTYAGVELWEDVAYFGLIPLTLAALGAVLGRRRPGTKYLAACFAATVLLSMDSPVLRLCYDLLPGFNLFRVPGRFLFLSTLFGIALAGVGLEEAIGRLKRTTGGARTATALAAALIVLIAVEGTGYARRYLSMAPQEQAVPDTGYRRYLSGDHDLFRVAPLFRPTINYGWAAPMGLQLVTGYDSFNYRHYSEYFDLMQSGRLEPAGARVWCDLIPVEEAGRTRLAARIDMLAALNVKYLLAPTALELPPERFELVEVFRDQPVFVMYAGLQTTDLFLYRNRHPVPRAFWAGRVVQADGEESLIDQVRQSDLSRVAVVAGTVRGLPGAGQSPVPTGAAAIRQARNGHLTIDTESLTGGYLIVSEVWHPGWRARLDGGNVPLYRTNLTLLGLVVPPGTHRLTLEFRPLLWRPGLIISLVSALALVGLGALLIAARGQASSQARGIFFGSLRRPSK